MKINYQKTSVSSLHINVESVRMNGLTKLISLGLCHEK
uniref:Uncharacterized protein n=1 Tax=Arundo donax TaxID=35708 RepID=A0A0A9AEF4_ARUDO